MCGGVALAMSPTFVEQLGRMVCATGFASAARPKACTLPMDRCSSTEPVCLRCCPANLLERHWRSQWHTEEACRPSHNSCRDLR